MVGPHEEAQHARGDDREDHGAVGEHLLPCEGGDDLADHAHGREEHDVHLRVSEEPEEVLPEDGIPSAPRIVESGAEGLIEEEHHGAGDEGAHRQHEEDARDHDHPDDDGHVERPHSRRPGVHEGDDEVDSAQEERHELQGDGDQPQRTPQWGEVVRPLR